MKRLFWTICLLLPLSLWAQEDASVKLTILLTLFLFASELVILIVNVNEVLL